MCRIGRSNDSNPIALGYVALSMASDWVCVHVSNHIIPISNRETTYRKKITYHI